MSHSKFFITIVFLFIGIYANAHPPKREFYQLKIYSIQSRQQEKVMDNYLEKAFMPAMHKLGIKKIGVFKPVEPDTTAFASLIYVLIPYKSIDQMLDIPKKLNNYKVYLLLGNEYINASFENPPYARFETFILQAFADAPVLQIPLLKGPKRQRVYELRSYEGHTEKIYHNKVNMFNEGGEIKLFANLGFNAVFYGQVLAGGEMPNLMYMTTFENKASRDEHWKSFGSSPEWLNLKSQPQYQNNVSKNTSFFLYPMDFSDI